MRLAARLLAMLSDRSAGLQIILFALVLSAPSLLAPSFADDFMHRILLRPELSAVGVEGLPLTRFFVFASGDPEINVARMEDGIFPWWTTPDLKVAFARPLSALTHILDDRLWPGQTWLYHAHSLAWFGLLLAALWLLFRRLHGHRVAVLALLLYALDDARGLVLSFVANRNALLAALAGIGVLLVHDRWRRDGWGPGAVLGPLLLGAGLLCGESAIATTALLFGYAVSLDRGSLLQRAGTLAPYALVVMAWQVGYGHAGFGVSGSGVYIHPLHDAGLYLTKVAERLPILLLGQWGPFPSDAWVFLPGPAKVAVFAVAVMTIVAVVYLSWAQLRASAVVRFWAIGTVFSALPVAASFPSDRLLVFVGMGSSAILAAVLVDQIDHPPAGRVRRVLLAALVLVHLVLAPVLLPLRCTSTLFMSRNMLDTQQAIATAPEITSKTLMVVSFVSETSLGYMRWKLLASGLPTPHRQRILSSGPSPVTVTRLDAQTLRLRPAAGYIPSEPYQMLRGPQRPMSLGESITLSDLTATVTAIDQAGRPQEAEFQLAVPLEDPSLVWMRGERFRLVPWTPPAIGETVVLPGEWSP